MRPVALVTGGSRNIGWSIARRFASSHLVVVGDLVPPPAPLPDGIVWVECDVRDYAACERLVAAATANGPLAALVHSAAITRPPLPFADISPAEWAEVIDVNLNGAFHVARAALAALKSARGSAVLISSRAARVGYAALDPSPSGTKPHYCAAKAGVISLTRSLAVELAPCGVRVNSSSPVLAARLLSCRLTAGWLRCRCCAARDTLPSRATATKARKACRSVVGLVFAMLIFTFWQIHWHTRLFFWTLAFYERHKHHEYCKY